MKALLQNRLIIRGSMAAGGKFWLLVPALIFLVTSFAATGFSVERAEARPTPAPAPAPSAPRTMKVPAAIDSTQADPNGDIPIAVKDVLDRDFRSRYPIAAPYKVDVLKTTLLTFTAVLINNGFGGLDTRHYFSVRVIHENGEKVDTEISLIERSNAEPDQDPIVVETFRITRWSP